MRTSKIRTAIENNSKVYGITFTFPAPALAEMAGYAGFDVLHLDMEHGVFDWNDVEDMCRAGNYIRCYASLTLIVVFDSIPQKQRLTSHRVLLD